MVVAAQSPEVILYRLWLAPDQPAPAAPQAYGSSEARLEWRRQARLRENSGLGGDARRGAISHVSDIVITY